MRKLIILLLGVAFTASASSSTLQESCSSWGNTVTSTKTVRDQWGEPVEMVCTTKTRNCTAFDPNTYSWTMYQQSTTDCAYAD
jgi:hypothetical protein